MRIDSGNQFARAERLHKVVVRASLQTFYTAFFTRARREQNDGDLTERWIVAHSAEQAEAVEPWHHDVGEDQVRRVSPHGFKSRFAIGDCLHLKAAGQQPA